MNIIELIRALGFRRGLRWWRRRLIARAELRRTEFPVTIHHGVKPSMPGYRQRR